MNISRLVSKRKNLQKVVEDNSNDLTSMDSIKELDFLSVTEGRQVEPEDKTRVVQTRLSRDVLIKTYEAQKTMLKIAHQTYRKSIGTKNEETMKKMFNDAVIDFNEFVRQYKKELLN